MEWIKYLLMALLVCATMMLCTGHAFATAYHESEDNDYMSTADKISVATGNRYSGTFTDYEDTDFIKFTISKGSEIQLTVSSSRPEKVGYEGGIMMYFYKNVDESDFYYLLAEYNHNMGKVYAKENLYLSKGTYYVSMSENSIDEPLNYELSFKTTTCENFSEPNDYIGQATKVTEGKKYKGILNTFNDFDDVSEKDFFRFYTGKKGSYYVTVKNRNIDGNAFSGSTLNLRTVDRYGNEKSLLDGKPYLNLEKGSSKTLLLSLPAGNTYFRFGSVANSGKYEFTLVKKIAAPKSVKAKLYGYDDIKVTWSKVTGATGYDVYYKKSSSGTYKHLGKYTSTSAKLKNLSDGAKYYVRIVPYKVVNGKKYKGFKKTASPVYTLKKVSGVKAVKNDKMVKISWKNIPGESGYQISKMTKKSATQKKPLTYKTTKGKYKKLSASKGKTYYYKVRAYKVVDGNKIYGPWSNSVKYKRK